MRSPSYEELDIISWADLKHVVFEECGCGNEPRTEGLLPTFPVIIAAVASKELSPHLLSQPKPQTPLSPSSSYLPLPPSRPFTTIIIGPLFLPRGTFRKGFQEFSLQRADEMLLRREGRLLSNPKDLFARIPYPAARSQFSPR